MSRLKLESRKEPAGGDTRSLLACGLEDHAGFTKLRSRDDDAEIECLLVRAQEMARYVESGALDAGITGHDWVVETGAKVDEVSELVYAKQRLARVRWVLAVPEDSAIREARHLEGKVVRDRGRAHHGKLSCQAWRKSPRGVFLGRKQRSKCRNLRTRSWR